MLSYQALTKIKHLTRELNYIDLFLLVIFGLLRYNPNVPPLSRRPDQRDRLECWLLVIVAIQYTILWLRSLESGAPNVNFRKISIRKTI